MTGKRIFTIAFLIVGMAVSLWADEEPGLLISGIVEDSPAAKAGLIRGDILLEIDGKPVENVAEIREILDDYKAGQRTVLTISRGGSERKVTLNLEDRLYRPVLGLEFANSYGRSFDFPRMRVFPDERFGFRFGVVVTEVIKDGPADRAGLKPMDAIISIDGERVVPIEFSESIASRSPGDRVTLEISRPGDDGDEPFEVEVRLDKNDDGGGFLGIRYSHMGMGFEMGPGMGDRFRDFERGFRDHFENGRREEFRFTLPMEEKSDI